MNFLCVFCGSKTGTNPRHAEAARQIAQGLLSRGWGLVFGGGHIGMMGVLADAMREGGGHVIGVIPRSLVERELAHPGLDDLRLVGSMHERKALMAELSQAFLALPGGFGTMDEMFEILTWAQLKFHDKPIGLCNVNGFYDPLLRWIDHAIAEGFIKPKYRDLLRVDTDVGRLLERLLQ